MPQGLTDAVKTGFWVAVEENTSVKSDLEIQLYPAPSRVEYPSTELGEPVETADGRVVFQVSNADPRRRTWFWSNYGPELLNYERQHRWLESLKSRSRYARQQSPFVYVLDASTGLLNARRELTINSGMTLAGTAVTIPNVSSKVAPDYLKNATLEVLPAASSTSAAEYERRIVTSATNTVLTLSSAFSTNTLGNSKLLLTWSQPVWWRARVLDTTRDLRNEGGRIRYTESRFLFVIDESMATLTDTLG